MKRIVLVAALAAALTASSLAVAATTTYSGSVGSGHLSFKVAKKHGKKTLRELLFQAVPISCNGGDGTASGQDKLDALPVKNDAFKVVLEASDPTLNAKLVFAGTLDGAGAKGTFHLSGKKVPLDGGDTGRKCDTGVLHWTASSK